MVEAVPKDLCDERHRRVNEQLERLNDHGGRLQKVENTVSKQLDVNDRIMEQLKEMDDRLKQIESKPARRFETIMNTIVQWATLALMAILASRIGL